MDLGFTVIGFPSSAAIRRAAGAAGRWPDIETDFYDTSTYL
jgi:hypothetical protein